MAELDRAQEWAELAPLIRRAVALDPAGLVRLRGSGAVRTAWVQLPFDVLAARSVRLDAEDPGDRNDEPGAAVDVTTSGIDALAWIEGSRVQPPPRLDLGWRAALPPQQGWRRLERVPDTAIRDVVRAGAIEIKALGGSAPRTEQALLDAVVLTATADGAEARISLRMVAALTRMGFLPRDSEANIDIAGRWMRVVAMFGSVYAERPGATLNLLG